MKEMDQNRAIQLFNRYAFESNAPPCEYDKITREIVKITGGLPLSLVVIGSSLYLESEEVCDDVLAKLKKKPHKEVQEVLKGKCRLRALHLMSCKRLIKTPNFSTSFTLERLVIKNCHRLVEIDPSITMLQHLKHLEIKGCILLWVLKGAPTTLNLDMGRQSWLDSLGNLKRLSTLRMENLALLQLPDSIGEIPGLQVLSLCNSFVKKLPKSIRKLKNLVKLIILSTNIIELIDSIGELKRLEIRDMEGCKLRKLPKTIGMLKKLEELDSSICIFLEGEIPMEIGELSSLKEQNLSGTHIYEVPPSISRLSQLTRLTMGGCEEL
ncbi:disease resistance protein RUN1-like [Eucalyptus grandis]|uniref:disease resistance protein RUN1-like n=1 Tax=Eucalyptus grandis TaxID=71139 RepID=UPI00192EC43C|nr:disease resistance protein RUN1-like [Eucalyptus grandis]